MTEPEHFRFQKILRIISFWGLLFFVTFIPISKAFSTIGELLCGGSLLISFFFKDFRTAFVQRLTKNKALWFLPVYYGLYLLGMTYTKDFNQGLHELNMNHYLLVIPLLVIGLNPSSKEIQYILYGFVAANLFSGIITIYLRVYTAVLFDSEPYMPSPFIMRPRASLNYALSVLLLLNFLKEAKGILPKLLLTLLTIVMFLSLIMLEGRIGQVAFVIAFPLFIAYRFLNKYRFLWFSLFLILGIGGATIAYFKVGNIQRRFSEAFKEFKDYKEGFKSENAENSSVGRRFVYFENNWKAFLEHPIFGSGTGDFRLVAEPYFTSDTYQIQYNKPHNEFLECLVKFGILGLFIFLGGWISNLFLAKKDVLYYSFTIIIFLSMFIESTLDTQSGITFFTAMVSLFSYKSELSDQ